MTQRMQVVVQNNIVNAALKPGNPPLKVPLVMRLVTAVPWLQGITARFVGLGVRPEHVQSPQPNGPSECKGLPASRTRKKPRTMPGL